MGGKKKIELPETPQFFEEPRFRQGLDTLFDVGGKLLDFDFSGKLSPLQDVISFNPEITKNALSVAENQLAPVIRDRQKDIINQLAANNQLESSVTADSLSRFNTDIANQFQSIVGQAALSDIDRALASRQSLFGTGINTITTGTDFANQFQGLRNDFNLRNFENQVSKIIAERGPGRGGLFGGLAGAAGGAALGIGLAPFTGGSSLLLAGVGGLAGGAAGALGPPGTGGQFLGAGTSLAGAASIGRSARALPGSTAGLLPRRKTDPSLFGLNPFELEALKRSSLPLSGGLN